MFDRHLELLWAGALGAIPVAVLVSIACRWFVRRPATRHALWVMVLGAMFMPTAYSGIGRLMPVRTTATPAPVHSTPIAPDMFNDGALTPGDLAAGLGEWSRTGEGERVSPSVVETGRVPTSQEPSAASADQPASRDWAAWWRMWIEPWAAWMARVRDALVGGPPMSAWMWWGGAGAVALAMVWRTVGMHRLVRSGEAAAAHDAAMVREVGELLGLRRTPGLVIVERVMTPMVVLGRPPRAMILAPRALWSVLDDDAKRAILAHELAHLRRRDHWVCWAHLCVACVFWWHPVCWWAGRRVREEADMACDAWVVSAMPRARRAYAESLLRVRMFVSSTPPLAPAPVLGMASSGVARFSRRITMVMTTNKSPRVSIRGGIAALAAATVAGLLAPALASTPEATGQATALRNASPEGSRTDESTEALLQRLREMQERVRAFESQVREYAASQGSPAGFGEGGGGGGGGDAALPAAPLRRAEGVPAAPGLPTVPATPSVNRVVVQGGVVERSYYLPEGKLRAVTELMSRSDVPVLILPGDDHITVRGTAAEHDAFLAFVRMICPEGVRVVGDAGATAGAVSPPSSPSVPALPTSSRITQSGNRFIFDPDPVSAEEAIERLNAHRDGIQASLRDSAMRQRQMEEEARRAEMALEIAQKAWATGRHDPAKAADMERKIAESSARIAELELLVERLRAERATVMEHRDAAQLEIERLRSGANKPASAGGGSSR